MYNFRRILVPTDFSPPAAAALRYAVVLGTPFQPEITLLHVDEFTVSPLGVLGAKREYIQTYQARKQEFLQERLSQLVAEVKNPNVRLLTQVLHGRA